MRIFIWSTLLAISVLLVIIKFAYPIIEKPKVEHNLPVHKTLYVERNMDDDELLAILKAAVEWKTATKGKVVFDIKILPQANLKTSNAIVIINVSPDYPDIMIMDTINGMTTLGYYNNRGLVKYIALVDDRISYDDQVPVILHELGHALGLEHPNTKEHPEIGLGSLMYSSIDEGANHITEEDLSQFCKLYHCSNMD